MMKKIYRIFLLGVIEIGLNKVSKEENHKKYISYISWISYNLQ